MRHAVAALSLLLAAPGALASAPAPVPDIAALRRAEARYAPVDLRVDLSRLPASERAALARLVEAGRIMDALFLRQVWAGNETLLARLAPDDAALARARLRFFLRNKGPWDRLDDDRAFVTGVPPKPPEANFYPAGATKADVERWLATLSGDERDAAAGFFTVIRRAPDGAFTAVPYSVEFQGELARAAALLRDAAAATTDLALRTFLEARAAAFLGNAYRDSDVAWMRLDGAIEPTVGPYEVYEDGWFNAKAAFEAFVGVRDDAETAKLARFEQELQGIEDALPIDAAMKRKLGALAPIRVVNEIFAGGDAARGVTTAAYNLPNDEWVTRTMGSKRVMLKNVQHAKFDHVLVPIARVALSPKDRANIAFDPFFTQILMHELVHGLGPHEVLGAPSSRTVRAALGETYSAIEEAKADVGGLFALEKLLGEGKLDRSMERTLYPTFLAHTIRSVRFGLAEAHGRSNALQLSWFLDAGAITARPDGTLAVDREKMRAAVVSLTRELMTIEGRGDRAAADALLQRLGVIRPEIRTVLDRLRDVPVDIAPRFVTADELTAAR